MSAGRRHRRAAAGGWAAALPLLLALLAATARADDAPPPPQPDTWHAPDGAAVTPAKATEPPPAPPPPGPPGGQLPEPTPLPPAVAPGPGGVLVDGVPLDPGTMDRILRGGGGCAACGGSGGCGCDSCGGSSHCHPGRKGCEPFPGDSFAARFIGGLYEGVCCPDPCYVPKWTGLFNSAFFVDSPRPATQTLLRWDAGWDVRQPDRAEFFWARADGKGLGPQPVAPYLAARSVNYDDLVMYTEAARGGFSAFFETTYRSAEAVGAAAGAGFGDMAVGTKSVLADSELFLLTLQFKTILPVGMSRKGLGPGHVSLEPSLIAAVRVTCDTAVQAQLAEWIPIGGDPTYAGAVLRYGVSVNHVWWRPVADVQLIGTAEVAGLAFQDGSFTDPVLGSNQRAAGGQYVSVGAGQRLIFCDKMDFGAGTLYAVTGQHLAQDLLRVEFRYRY